MTAPITAEQKIIIHVHDGIDTESAFEYLAAVINRGRISAGGQSYSYATRFNGIDGIVVTTDKPNANGTIRFDVRLEDSA